MKKHLYLVLFCVMLMPMFNTYAEEDNSLAYEEAKVVLEAINQPFYDSDDLVTRASFTQKLISMISFSIPDAKSYFSDVNLEAEYAPELTAAYEMGIVNSKEFRPDDVITVTEAAAMMVRALGYEVYVQKDGGYPNGYLNRAGILELFKGIDTYEQVSERMAGIMFLNFLNADIAEISYDGSIVISEGKSILNTDYDIEYDTGILAANEYTSVYYGGKSAPLGYVVIGNEIYKASLGISDYIGYNLKYYYKENDGEKEIVGFLPYRTDILEIDSEDVLSMDNGILHYEVNEYGKTDKTEIRTSIDLIYNGVRREKYTNEIYENTYGRIVFIDNDSDGEYDIAKITSYRNVVAGAINSSDYIIYDKDGKGSVELSSDRYSKVEIIKDGKQIGFEDIKHGDVLSIAENTESNKLIRAYVISDVLFGSVNEKHSDGTLVINASEFKTSIFDEININDYGYFYFDILGTICAFEKEMKNQYAYLISVWQNEGDDRVNIRIFNQGGEVKESMLSKKVNIDGTSFSSFDKAYLAIKEAEEELIRLDINDSGEVYRIDTERENENVTENDFIKAFPEQVNKNYKSGSGIFGGVCGINAKTIIFAVPEDVRDYNGYSIKKLSYFSNDDDYSFDGYDPNEVNILSAMVIKATENSSIHDKSPIGVISKISQSVNNDNEVSYKLDMATNGTMASYFVKEDEMAKTLSVGDIIRYSLDSKFDIESLKMTYRADGAALSDAEVSDNSPSNGNFDSKYRVALGTVCRKIDDYMTVEINGSIETMKIVKNTMIYVIEEDLRNSGKKIIRVGKETDIFDNLSEPSKILVRTRYGDLSEIVVLKGGE